MRLANTFTVPVALDQAWQVLLDVERIAPCMPGATLDEVDGAEFRGRVKVKLGPITMTYAGVARFVDKDDATHTAVIDAAGKETRGGGTARATVRTVLAGRGEATEVTVLTDLAVTGKPAQFGRGVMAEVSAKLIAEFADRLAAQVSDGANTPPAIAETSTADDRTAPLRSDTVDLAGIAGVPVAKRLVPVLVGLLVAWRLVHAMGRRRRSRRVSR
ncbi:MAG: hypothetical protein GEV28_25340 [Actinophytocola sp.]|uniref:SRPBCC family protein n=1 Tax=Actinophytocola sp. TaxID=1872138 RepID=UPI0013214D61|nr:SRPBCC family protein [Actinophytocola sp.]MPZ83537.1 hypothetical protein [Actinophytocola sp.]